MSGLYGQQSPENQQRAQRWVNERWHQLYELLKTGTSEAFSYTFLTNAGGAVAVLSFLGASDVARQAGEAKACLFLFTVGVIFAGLLRLSFLHHTSIMLASWSRDARAFYGDKTTEEELDSADDKRADGWLLKAQYIFGYLSFFCFVAGCILGYRAL